MATVVRLARATLGRKWPIYRVVAADTRSPRDQYLETLGWFDPNMEPERLVVRWNRLQFWLEKGAVPTENVVGVIRRTANRESSRAGPISDSR